MSEHALKPAFLGGPWMRENLFLGMTFGDYVRSLLTPANAVAAVILLAGIPTIAYRFWKGLGAATNLSQTNPWGIWVAFDVVCGVALAAGGYTVACAVYIFGQKTLKPILRPAILTGFLGYALVLLGLVVDLGQPWRLPYQFFLTPGTTAVMYEVGWCVFLYLMVLGLEFLPAALEWLGLVKLRRLLGSLTIGIIVIGVFFFAKGHGAVRNFVEPSSGPFNLPLLGAFGVGLVASLWAYKGWEAATYSAGEVKNPRKNLPLGILIGTVACIVLYVLANLMLVALGAYIEIVRQTGVTAAASIHLLATPLFIGGVILSGMLLPLAIFICGTYLSDAPSIRLLDGVASLLILGGGLLLRFEIITSGVRIAVR